jgi:GH25 family lysozyme M1 (1,4-beta-N-acetylmuramidase)
MYWKFSVDAVRQTNYYLDNIGEVQFPPIVDVEREYNVRPGTNQPIVSVLANRNHLGTVLSLIEEKTGIKPMIYTNYASWLYLFGNWDQILNYPLWVANWRTAGEPYLPKPAVKYDLHQWTRLYRIAGYYRGVDANWFNGNEGDFEAYIDKYDKLWRPAPPPEEKVKVVTLETVKDGNTSIHLLEPGDSIKVSVDEV